MSEDTDRDSAGGLFREAPVSRRGVLIASGAIALWTRLVNVVASDPGSGVVSDDIVLSKEDLLEQTGIAYVDRSGDPTATPLVRHLTDSVSGFRAASGAVSGFVAGGSARRVPLYVESAAFDAASVPFSAIADATEEWIRSIYDEDDAGRCLEVDRRRGDVTWTIVTRDGWQDSFQVQRVGDRVLFTVAYGRRAAATTPGALVERSARIMRAKAA